METKTEKDRLEVWQEVVADTSLSWGAKGFLFHLLRKPPEKRVSVSVLMEISKEKRHAAKSLLEEVENSRYSHLLGGKSEQPI